MKRTIPLLTGLIMIFIIPVKAQNLIGYHKNEISGIMKKVHPGYRTDASAVNSPNPSIKFIGPDKERTLIYFLDNEGSCVSVKFMLENNHLKNTVDTLMKNYEYAEELVWKDKSKGKDCLIILKKNEWFSTVFITLNQ